ncbi:class I SAM-dependent methyltransferase [Phenylobacterium sp.]|uniref:class I SAM-dependent methyltransferase n=1 Tax=Phenylobacterium sp. TaxID=1871053 RepID=UPI002810F170|nr:class I SAM-dependent methyltransferase [Phenylobacterium sp.]
MTRPPLIRLARRALEVSGLIAPIYRAAERRLVSQAETAVDDGRPMPPADLRVAVAGTAGQKWFSERGQADTAEVLRLARAHGAGGPLEVLDLGCGCGRVARWLAPEVIDGGGRFVGSDLNPKLVAWCQANLPGEYRVNGLKPPLAEAEASLNLVYAYSVLTHLREPVAMAWLAEIARVLRPGGLALLTFHDEDYAEAWGPAEVKARGRPEGWFVLNDAMQGSNYMSSWTTREHFAAMAAAHFDVAEIIPGGREVASQAMAVLRAR